MRVKQAAVAALWVAVGGGCAHGTATAAERRAQAASYYPLAVGNQWTYDVSTLSEHGEHTVRILREEGGRFIDDGGGEIYIDAFGIRDAKRYMLREPIEPGREWTNVVSVSSVEHLKVLEAGVPCETPAGRFADCVRVQDRNRIDAQKTLAVEWTFAQGVGLVRVDTLLEAQGKVIPQAQLVLKAYQLAPGK
jgi:hypothetical protein